MRQAVNISVSLFTIAVCIFLIDRAVGKIDGWLPKMSGGTTQTSKVNYGILECEAECVILGSSRANHHYHSQMLADSLDLTVYNAGCDGQGLPYCYCLFRAICRRYLPRIVVLELSYNALAGEPADRINSVLKPYYRVDPTISTMLDAVNGPAGKYKCMSSLFRYNSQLLHLAQDYMVAGSDNRAGYMPLTPNSEGGGDARTEPTNCRVDSLSRQMLTEMVRFARDHDIRLFVVVSPALVVHPEPSTLESFCREQEVPFFDNSNPEEFMEHAEWFNDATHLNEIGAEKYTAYFIRQLRTAEVPGNPFRRGAGGEEVRSEANDPVVAEADKKDPVRAE